MSRLLHFLDTTPHPPSDPSQLTASHVDAFLRHREASLGTTYALRELRDLGRLFRIAPLRDLTPTRSLDYLWRRVATPAPEPKPGYSDNEFRQIVAAARADIAAMRDRIDASESLLEQYESEPRGLAGADRERAELLAAMATAGTVPLPSGGFTQMLIKRRELAEQLFVTRRDLVAMLVLLVATTGYNIEAVKELPAEHRLIEDRAVEVVVTKRRRGPRRWHQTVTWEIGPPGRELHTPGGVYLLLHRLMSRSRCFMESSSALWGVWRNVHRPLGRDGAEHYNPFGAALNSSIYAWQWVDRHELVADSLPPSPPSEPEAYMDNESAALSRKLALDFTRLKTSVDVRRTRQVGGHLPSAARTNTIPVLFQSYLRKDPTTIEWAAADRVRGR